MTSSRYFSPYGLNELLTSDGINVSNFSVVHNNLVSLKHNLEHLQVHRLDGMDFKFVIIGITETKITHSNRDPAPFMTGYNFEHVPTPLSFGGVGMFIKETFDFQEHFQALWIEIPFSKQKNIICGIIYRQHN